jgi:hypothetical protein
MPRTNQAIAEIISKAVADVIARIVPVIQRQIAALAAAELDANLAVSGRARSRAKTRRPKARVEITKWVADRHARRVPTFVIELTGGLDTKKKIVAKYGPGVVFEKGKTAPKAKAA